MFVLFNIEGEDRRWNMLNTKNWCNFKSSMPQRLHRSKDQLWSSDDSSATFWRTRSLNDLTPLEIISNASVVDLHVYSMEIHSSSWHVRIMYNVWSRGVMKLMNFLEWVSSSMFDEPIWMIALAMNLNSNTANEWSLFYKHWNLSYKSIH